MNFGLNFAFYNKKMGRVSKVENYKIEDKKCNKSQIKNSEVPH